MNPCLSNVPRDNVYSLFHHINHLHQMDMITNGLALEFHKRYQANIFYYLLCLYTFLIKEKRTYNKAGCKSNVD